MSIETLDYHSLFLDEGKDFYQCLCRINRDEFNQWLLRNIVKVGEIDSYEHVKPDSSIVKLSDHLGYAHRDFQCHYSAKAITILLPEFEYWTGFVSRYESINPIITHSFNVYQNCIVDFSKHITDPFYKLDLKSYPHEYFGVNIPREFVLKFRNETLNEHSMNPLICEWCMAEI